MGRANFTPRTKRLLRSATGNRCSYCGHPLWRIVNGAEVDVGEIAHIASASRRDRTRPDPLLSDAERRSALNGFPVDRICHRVTDRLSVAACVAIKGTAIVAADEAPPFEDAFVRSPTLQAFADYFEKVPPACQIDVTRKLRELLVGSYDPSPLLEEFVGYIGSFPSDGSQAKGIAATLLVTLSDRWNPSCGSLADVERWCSKLVRSERWEMLFALEPATNALTRKGRPAMHRKLLGLSINDATLSRARLQHDRNYHGDRVFSGWRRHLADTEHRRGLARADDLPPIIEILDAEDPSPATRRALEAMLRASLLALQEGSEGSLVSAATRRYRLPA